MAASAKMLSDPDSWLCLRMPQSALSLENLSKSSGETTPKRSWIEGERMSVDEELQKLPPVISRIEELPSAEKILSERLAQLPESDVTQELERLSKETK